MHRLVIRTAHQLDKFLNKVIRVLDLLQNFFIRMAEFILPDGLATAIVAIFVQIFFGTLKGILFLKELVIPLRAASLIMVASPQIVIALIAGWKLNIYAALFILAACTAMQYVIIPFRNWGLGWTFRLVFPYQYWEAMKRGYPGTADEKGWRFVAPLLGVPQLKNNSIDFFITPSVGRSLADLDKIMEPLAAQFPFIKRIYNEYNEDPNLSKGILKIMLKNAPNKPIEKRVPKPTY